MKAEILCIGTELLLGQIVNTNAAWLGQRLAELGVDVHRSTVVGDNLARVADAIAGAWDRADLLLLTGGLGPTSDDLTHEALAQFWGRPLVERPEIVARLEQLFRERNITMAPSNRKQALLPQGADVLPNPAGTAPGAILRVGNHLLLTFPGVPHELKAMWHATAAPLIEERVGRQIIHSKVLRFVGIAESKLAEAVQDLLDATNPTVAPLAGTAEVILRITAKAPTPSDAQALIAPVAAAIRERVGNYCYGEDEQTLEEVVVKLLCERDESLGVAESASGGWLGQRITKVPGCGKAFLGGVISYDVSIKTRVLGVAEEHINEPGPASAVVAKEMAAGVRKLMQSTWGLSITGEAGPKPAEPEKPVGLVYVGISGPDFDDTRELRLGQRDRDEIRWMSTQAALELLRRKLLGR